MLWPQGVNETTESFKKNSAVCLICWSGLLLCISPDHVCKSELIFITIRQHVGAKANHAKLQIKCYVFKSNRNIFGAYIYISTKQIRDRGNKHKRVHLCFLPSIQHAGCFPNRAFSIRPTCIQPPRSSAPARIGWHRLKAEERWLLSAGAKAGPGWQETHGNNAKHLAALPTGNKGEKQRKRGREETVPTEELVWKEQITV